MSNFFWKRERTIEQLMDQYLEEMRTCLDLFKDAVCTMLEDSTSQAAADLVLQVDQAESRCDELRRQIEMELYGKALMPESRGDLLGLIEALDKVPNWAEEMAYDIHLQRVVFPQTLHKHFCTLVEKNVQCVHVLYEAASAIFKDIDVVFTLAQTIRQIENEIDDLEHQLIREVFDIEERLSYQNLLHRTIRGICDISDKAQNVAERLTVLAAKRQI
ncbi:hypothetical protein U27_03466 [Candidatus Vecturithrix granuli]|uniref:Phosphate transport regulator n=1 Tax=Vecturithrix granuli TaxID=1499967 RepID=A0A081BVZ9_VECG1|nr:hypothetical protein U27_03466 [Candidatus Vecturithrix granuli]